MTNTLASKTKNITQLLTALNQYSWDRFLVGYEELLTDIEPLDNLIKKEASQAGYIAQYADENLDSRDNLFYSLTLKAFKWDLEDAEPKSSWKDKFCMKLDPFFE